MSDLNTPVPLEDGVTFEENSLIKARALVEFTDLPALIDDSGIYVDITGGALGIFSVRRCGAYGDDVASLDLLLTQLTNAPGAHRGAAFVPAAALVLPDGREFVEHDEVRDTPIRERRGEGGFGYGPISVPEGCSRASAEFSLKGRDAISHRGKAFRALLPAIIEAMKGR